MIRKNRVEKNRKLLVEFLTHVLVIAVAHGLYSMIVIIFAFVIAVIAALVYHTNWFYVALFAVPFLVLVYCICLFFRVRRAIKRHIPQLSGDWTSSKNVNGKLVELKLHLDQSLDFLKAFLECVTNGRKYKVELRLERSVLFGTFLPINDGCVEPGTLIFKVALDGQSLTCHLKSAICNSDTIPSGKYVFKRA